MDLSKIKLLILDFDDTLALHRAFRKHWVLTGKRNEYFKQAYLQPETFYDTVDVCIAPYYMQKFVAHIKNKGIVTYCVSGLSHSLNAKAKQCFVTKHYGNGIQLLCAATQEVKPEVVSILCSIHDCSPSEVLCIDDSLQTVELFRYEGYNALLRHEVEELADNDYRICIDATKG